MFFVLFQFREHAWTGFKMNDRTAVEQVFKQFDAGYKRISGVDSDGMPWSVNCDNVTFVHLKNFEEFQRQQQEAMQKMQQMQQMQQGQQGQQSQRGYCAPMPGGWVSGRN